MSLQGWKAEQGENEGSSSLPGFDVHTVDRFALDCPCSSFEFLGSLAQLAERRSPKPKVKVRFFNGPPLFKYLPFLPL